MSRRATWAAGFGLAAIFAVGSWGDGPEADSAPTTTTTVASWASLDQACGAILPRPTNCPDLDLDGFKRGSNGQEVVRLEGEGIIRVDCDSPQVLCDDEDA